MNDFTGKVKRDEWRPPAGFRRTITIALDTAQYQLDMDALARSRGDDLYSTFNLLMRRKPKVPPPGCCLVPKGPHGGLSHLAGTAPGVAQRSASRQCVTDAEAICISQAFQPGQYQCQSAC